MSLARIIRALASLFFMALFIGLPTSKGIASVGVGGLLGVSILELLKNGFPKVSRSDWQLWMPLCLLLLLIISFFRSEDTDTAWKVLYRQNTLLILPLALLVFKDIFQKQFRLFFQLFIAANSFAALLTLFFFFLPSALCIKITQQLAFLQDYIVHEKVYAFGVYSPFLDRLHFSYLLATSILLQLWFLFQPKENAMTSKIYHSIALLLNLCCLMILGGRGAQLGFLLSAAIWIYLIYRQYLQSLLVKKLGSFVATSSLVGVLLINTVLIPYLAYRNIPAVQSRYQQLRWEIGTVQDGTYQNYPYEHFTSLRRLMSWKYTWQLIKEQPILGIGLGDHNAELQSLYDRDQLKIPINSHQQYLYFWIVTGIAGFVLFLLLFGKFLYTGLQQKSWTWRALSLSFGLFYAFVFLLDSPLVYQTGSLAFWVFFLVFSNGSLRYSSKN